jgi:hypothetical protein
MSGLMTLPNCTLVDCRPTRGALPLCCQIVGKIRFATTLKKNRSAFQRQRAT